MSYDYVVIGAGSAGCAVAGRLCEDKRFQVLLLEAGGPDDNPDIHIPALFSNLFHTELDWDYETIPQSGLNGRKEYVPRKSLQKSQVQGDSSRRNIIPQHGTFWKQELGGL